MYRERRLIAVVYEYAEANVCSYLVETPVQKIGMVSTDR